MEVQKTPLRTAIMRLMSEMLDNPCKHGLYDTGRFMDRIEQLLCDMMAAPEVMQLSGSEAIFGLMGWLTTRDETTVLGPNQQVDVSIIERFVETNRLSEPRAMWDSLLVHPAPLEPNPVETRLEVGGPGLAVEADLMPVPEDSALETDSEEPYFKAVLTRADGNVVVIGGTLPEILFKLTEGNQE